jgi:hypothetical protein
MKALKKTIVLFIAALLAFGGCQTKSATDSDSSHLALVPDDAFFVVGVEYKKILEKGGLNKPDDFKFYSLIRSEFAEQSPGKQEFFDKLFKDSKATGLDLDVIYIYGQQSPSKDGINVSALIKMNDESKFLSVIKELGAPEPVDKGDYKIISESEDVAMVWNKNYFLFTGGSSIGEIDFAKYFSLPVEKSILSNPNFEEFQKTVYDIGVWGDYNAFLKQLDMMNVKMPGIPEGINYHAYLNFENGEIKGKMLCTPKEKIEAFWAEYPIVKKDFNESLLQDFPEQSFLTMKMAVNVEAYLKFFKEMVKNLSNTGGYNPYGDIHEQLMAGIEDPTLNKIIKTLGGDFVLSLYGFAHGAIPIPLTGIGFTVNSEKDFQELLALLPTTSYRQEGNYYTIADMGGAPFPIYFAYKDKKIYVTDDLEAIKKFLDKGFDKSLANGALGEKFKQAPYIFHVNLDVDAYPETLRFMLQSSLGREYKMLISFLNIYESFTISMNKDFEIEGSLKFKNSNVNGLKQLLRNIDENTSSYFK